MSLLNKAIFCLLFVFSSCYDEKDVKCIIDFNNNILRVVDSNYQIISITISSYDRKLSPIDSIHLHRDSLFVSSYNIQQKDSMTFSFLSEMEKHLIISVKINDKVSNKVPLSYYEEYSYPLIESIDTLYPDFH